MRYLKMFRLAALAAALMAFLVVGTASATVIENVKGTPLPAGTSITAESENKTELHTPFGSINCVTSHVGGKTTNAGGVIEGTTVGVRGTVTSLSFSECNATITPVTVVDPKTTTKDYGSLEIVSNSNGNDGALYGTGQEVTVSYLGFHCIFKTNKTKLGTVTGSGTTGSNATLDIEATLPRTGGNSGSFCGTTAQWTGSLKFTTPNPLYVT